MNTGSLQPKITTDSRAVEPGFTFIAIQGDTFDGHQFIAQAIQKGAIEIVAETAKLTPTLRASISATVKLCEVNSSLDEIRKRAHDYRKNFTIPFIAVVGSVGKTTTKELIASLLQGRFKEEEILKTEGSQNGFFGIPLTLLKLKPETKIAVIEVGIDDIGAMAQHLKLVEPTHVILTAIGPEHLHQLKTVEIAASEELLAFDYALKHSLPMAINLSDEYVSEWILENKPALKLESNSNIKTYSLIHKNQNDIFKPNFIGKISQNNLELEIFHDQQSLSLAVPLPGEHHAHNLLAAVTLTQFFNLTREEIKTGLATFKTAFGRTEIYTLKNGATVIGDYYNSNPTSAVAALKLLKEKTSPEGKSFAVLGDMLELGDHEELFHRGLAKTLRSEQTNEVLLYGPRMKWLKEAYPQAHHFETHETLIQALKPQIKSNDTVLIKGSRGMKMEAILKAIL